MDQEILDAMEANLLFQMTYFPKHLSFMKFINRSDVKIVRSDIPDTNFNYVMNARLSQTNLKRSVINIVEEFKATPFAWWVAENEGSVDLINCLKTQGFSKREAEVGMSLSLESLPLYQQKNLNIKRVCDSEGLKDFSQVMVSLGEYPFVYDHFFSKIPTHLYTKQAPFELHVAYQDHTPVTTGIIVIHGGVGGVYYIMTHPDHRKKGYATAMTTHLLNRIKRRGMNTATLQASPMGKSLYEKIGFTPMCCFVECIHR